MNTTKKQVNQYIKNQLERLQKSEYSKSIRIYDGEGNSTNYFNVDEKSFNKIKKILLEMKE